MANIVQTGFWTWEITFEYLDEWMVPLIHIVPIFSLDDGFSWDNLGTFLYDFNYIWEKVGTSSYKVYTRLYGFALDSEFKPISLYIDFDLWISNDKFLNSVQHNLGA